MPIKIIQIGNNLNVNFDEKKFTLNVKNVDVEKLFKYAFLYNQNSTNFYRNQLNKFFNFSKEISQEKIERKKLNNQLNKLKGSNNWKIVKEDVFYNSFKFPKEFVDYIKKAKENNEDITPYKNFIEKLASCPVEHVRDNFFTYMRNCNLKITPSGNIIAYRYVKTMSGNVFDLEEAREINKLYLKTKLNKKSPSNVKYKNGTLADAYKQLEACFTDARTKSQQYELGSIISMPLKKADTSEARCSSGFHFTNFEGIDKLAGYSFGDVLVMGIIDPSQIVSIPLTDSYPKFRCIEWYFAGIIDSSFAQEFENSNISVLDEDFEVKRDVKYNKDPFKIKEKMMKLKEEIKKQKKEVISTQVTIISKL